MIVSMEDHLILKGGECKGGIYKRLTSRCGVDGSQIKLIVV